MKIKPKEILVRNTKKLSSRLVHGTQMNVRYVLFPFIRVFFWCEITAAIISFE